MRSRGRRLAAILAVAGALSPAFSAEAQGPPGSATLIGGVEGRSFRFAPPFTVRRIAQTAIPVGLVAVVGRYTFDVGSYWAATAISHRNGAYRRVTGFTDTQARVARTFGRDVAVASVLVNLPTGIDRMAPADFDVLGAVSSPFLAFPVNAYANGGSVTVALAAALPAGAWNFGAAASVRASRTFTPVVDPTAGPLNYRAGVEGRLRLGVDRLVGSSRVAVGLTVSGFGDDAYAGLGVARGAYRPGVRWIAEGTVTVPAGAGLMTGTVWGYRRAAGDTAGVPLDNRETLSGVTVTGGWPVSPRVSFEPGVEARFSGVEGGRGLVAGGGVGARLRLGRGISAWAGVRYDTGYLDLRSLNDGGQVVTNRTDLQSWSGSAFLRLTRQALR